MHGLINQHVSFTARFLANLYKLFICVCWSISRSIMGNVGEIDLFQNFMLKLKTLKVFSSFLIQINEVSFWIKIYCCKKFWSNLSKHSEMQTFVLLWLFRLVKRSHCYFAAAICLNVVTKPLKLKFCAVAAYFWQWTLPKNS